jgi:hypothetical protein
MGAYAPVTGKIFQNVQKINLAREVSQKTNIICKRHNFFHAKPFLTPNFVFLRITQNYNFL